MGIGEQVNHQGTTPAFRPVPLAIIGMGCLFPKADGPQAFWANIKGGVDAITDIPKTHWDTQNLYSSDPSTPDTTYSKRGAFLEPVEFNPLEFGIAPNNLEAIDTTQLLGMVVAQQALRDAGYATGKEATNGKQFNRDKMSVILGVTGALEMVIPLGARLGHPIWRKALEESGVEKAVAEDVVQRIAEAYVPWQENSFPGLLGNVAAGRIANKFDLGGTNCVVDAACASSLGALHMAAMELYAGRSDMAITGGLDTFNDIFMYTCFSKTPALSATGSAKPFSAAADGTALGEGLGVIILKRLDDALRDGDTVRAVIRSIGSSSDGKGNAVYAPSSNGQIKCILSAYEQAQVSPATIELVEAHGTGTKVGDAVESKALDQVFRAAAPDRKDPWCALGSVKSMIGHTKSAAGIAGLMKAALALDHKVLPPTIKVEQPFESLEAGKSALYVNTEARPWVSTEGHPRRAGVSAFGFGGSNFHCLLEEASPGKREVDWSDETVILPFSADSREALAAAVEKLDRSWKNVRVQGARLRASFSAAAACRVILVAQKETGVEKVAGQAVKMLRSDQRPRWSLPEGVTFSEEKAHGKLGVLFPGQGSQYVGMMRDLACQFPEMLAALEGANAAFAGRLSDAIYPVPVFADAARKVHEERLADTALAQPALGAVSVGAWRLLQRFGVKAEAAGGHSFGELVALWAAGRIDEPTIYRLAALRGKAMAAAAKGDGAMLAVMAPVADVEAGIATEKLAVVIANKNAPNQVVLSGATAAIEGAEKALAGRGMKVKRLNVSAAFHSELVAAARLPFAQGLEGVKWAPGTMPVFANSTGEQYPPDPTAAADMLANQLARPVEFVKEIEGMYTAGVRTFLETGPGGKLSALVKAILGDRPHAAVAIDVSNGKKSGIYDLGCALAHLAALGHPLDLTAWDAEFARRAAREEPKKPGMSVILTGANYKKPREKRPARVIEKPAAVKPAAIKPPQQPQPTSERGRVPLNHKPVVNGNGSPSTHTPANVPAALQATQQSILMLQKMQEQTAQLHAQYLAGQEAAQATIHQLLEQQMRLLGAPGAMPAMNGAQHATIASPRPVAAVALPKPVAPLPIPVQVSAPVVAKIAAPKREVAAPAAPTTGKARTVLLEVIADKTGYPVEMLELDMSLDADLGIDSIKRVEILSALQTQLPDAPIVKPEDLGRLQTLRHIVDFLEAGSNTPALKTQPALKPAPAGESQSVLLEVVAEKTGYPVEMLELDMSLDADLGIDSIKRVEILSALQTKLPNAPVVKPEDLGRLQTLREIVAFLDAGATSTASLPRALPILEAPAAVPAAAASPTPVRSVAAKLDRQILTVVPLDGGITRDALSIPANARVWVTDDRAGLSAAICNELHSRNIQAQLVALNETADVRMLAGLLIVAPADPQPSFIQQAFALVQRAAPSLRGAGQSGAAFLASASSMDGCFALNGHTPRHPITGGLAGLIKTASHEWPEVSCKSLDLSHDLHDVPALAAQIVDELLLKGPTEVGIAAHGRCETRLVRRALNGEAARVPLTASDVIVVTGGARGVTAAVSIALAKAYHCKLLLLGRSAPPTPEPAWLASLEDQAKIKKAIAAQIVGATPKSVEEHYRLAMGNREVLRTLAAIEAAGATVLYRSLDVRDAAAVADAIADARNVLGPITGIIHGAGVLQDRLIEQKTAAQFDEVFSTKVGGFEVLLEALRHDALKVIVAFSSSTGRFGRRGQVAYAAANEVLNKLAQHEAHQRPTCRVLSMNWGPWEGGMVTPQLKKLFASEGVGLIPLEAGAEYLVQEMSTPAGGPVEIVILGPEPGKIIAPGGGASALAADASMTLAFERDVSVATHPFLKSHVIKGKAVVPAAIIVEWLAHGAMHDNPGLAFQGFDDLRIFKGVTLGGTDSVTLQVLTSQSVSTHGVEHVLAELRSGPVLHARATILLGAHLPAERAASAPLADQPLTSDVYTDGRLFHGSDLQGISSIEGWSTDGIVGHAKQAPAPGAWMKQPLRSSWIADPLILDSAFQLMILWCFETHGVGSLPTAAGKYRQHVRSFPTTGARIQARVVHAGEHSAEASIDFVDAAGNVLATMESYECVMDASLEGAFAANVLV